MSWKRVKSIKGGRGTQFGSIGKDGRLLLPSVVASAANFGPGTWVELMVADDEDMARIGIVPVRSETAYSVKVTTTGKIEDYGKGPGEKGRTVSLIVPLRHALNELGRSVVKRLRVVCFWDADLEGIVIELPSAQVTQSEIVEVSA